MDVSVDFQWSAGKSVPLFVDLGWYIIPVDRDMVKSLTVDFLDRKVISGLTIGFGVGFSSF